MYNKGHQATRNSSGNWHRQNPSPKNPNRHPPIHSLPIPITQSDRQRRTNDTLRRTNRQSKSTRQQNRQRTSQFHAKSSARGMQRQSVAEIFHDIVAPCRETDDDS